MLSRFATQQLADDQSTGECQPPDQLLALLASGKRSKGHAEGQWSESYWTQHTYTKWYDLPDQPIIMKRKFRTKPGIFERSFWEQDMPPGSCWGTGEVNFQREALHKKQEVFCHVLGPSSCALSSILNTAIHLSEYLIFYIILFLISIELLSQIG